MVASVLNPLKSLHSDDWEKLMESTRKRHEWIKSKANEPFDFSFLFERRFNKKFIG
jgi:hypothetical protein